MSRSTAAYWEPLWASGRRYLQIDDSETRLLERHPGPGLGRPALDIGCGDGQLTHHLHHRLGYRATGIDCSPSALALARARPQPALPGPTYRLVDVTCDGITAIPEPAYNAITCRLVFSFLPDKPAFLSLVRRLLAPGGTFWVLTELAERCPPERRSLGITAQDVELLTTGWSRVRGADLGRLRCYALRP
ncbi:class I SAM-dependent methyltransferase [Streptomyces sp. NPDC052301]|uniref:class I SAM-dependent methyltransferase n=1 Tax=Streptomyces sp. NPDC052301 TaxID=3365687 RepID=UPI0037D1B26C